MKAILKKLQMVFPDSDLNRIIVKERLAGSVLLIVDVHGMNRYEAKRFLCNLINLVNKDFDLDVIHGFNHGTILRDMLKDDFHNPHVCGIQIDIRNPGITHMKLAA